MNKATAAQTRHEVAEQAAQVKTLALPSILGNEGSVGLWRSEMAKKLAQAKWLVILGCSLGIAVPVEATAAALLQQEPPTSQTQEAKRREAPPLIGPQTNQSAIETIETRERIGSPHNGLPNQLEMEGAHDNAASPIAEIDPAIRQQQAQIAFDESITKIVRAHIPHTFDDTSDWGLTDNRWDGLHVQLDGLRLRTKRRRKEVNHGRWSMYTCELIDPANQFRVSLHDVRPGENGHTHFDVDVNAFLKLHGRVARWTKGVQLYSVSADANARVQLKLSCTIRAQFVLNQLPPDFQIEVAVQDADLQLAEFDVYRVSKLGGEPAQQVGRGMRHFIDKKLESKRDKLVEKINREIKDHEDDLRLSLYELMKDDLKLDREQPAESETQPSSNLELIEPVR